MNKIYYKIFQLIFQDICFECGKKELIPNGDFFIDETEADLVFRKMGTEERIKLKRGFIDMKYVAGFKFSRLAEKLLEEWRV